MCKWRSLLDPQISVWSDLRFGDRTIFIFRHLGLKLPVHAHLEEVLGHISPNEVIYRCNLQKALPWAEGQDRTGQSKSHKGVIFHLFGGKPQLNPFSQKNCTVVAAQDVISCANFWAEIFKGLRFYRGSDFPFSYWFFHAPYNSAAPLRCLWYVFARGQQFTSAKR